MSASSDGVERVVRALRNPAAGLESHYLVRCGERRVAIDIATDSDWDPTSVAISCAYDVVARADPAGYRGGAPLTAARPLGLTLEPENAADVEAKASGLSLEWQAGDPAFDRAVYVHTPTTDPAVLSAVLGEATRRATLELFSRGFEKVEIDVAGKVTATIPAGALKGPDLEARLSGGIGAFGELIGDLPVVITSGVAHAAPPLRTTTLVLGVIGAGGWLLNIGWAAMVTAAAASLLGRSGDLSWGATIACVAIGLLAGFVGAGAYGAAMDARARGRSDAHKLGSRARLSAFGCCSVLAFTIALVCAVATAR